jgi:hypothetical protein
MNIIIIIMILSHLILYPYPPKLRAWNFQNIYETSWITKIIVQNAQPINNGYIANNTLFSVLFNDGLKC